MHKRCEAAVEQAAKALGRKTTKAEINDIDRKVRDAQKAIATKDLDAWRGMTQDERMKAVGEQLAIEFKNEAVRKTQNASKQIAKELGNKEYVSAFKEKHGDATRALMHIIANITDNKGNRVSAESYSKAVFSEHMAYLDDLIQYDKEGTTFAIFSDPKRSEEVVSVLLGEKKSADPALNKAVDALRKTMDSIARTYNDKGGDIHLIKDYVPQSQDMIRVRKVGKQVWVDHALEHIDRNKLFDDNGNLLNDAEARDFLGHAYDNLSTGGMFNDKTAKGSSAIANRHRQHRQLHWKDAASWRFMQEKYGAGTLLEQTMGHIKNLSDEIALMDAFGPNAIAGYEKIREHARSLSFGDEKFQDKINHVERAVEKMAGINQGVSGYMGVHRFFTAFKNSQIASKLGSIITSQLADNGTSIMTARALNIPLSKWAEMKAAGYTDKQMKRMAAANGIAFEGMIQGIQQFSDGAHNSGVTSKLASATMTLSGANILTKTHRTAFAALIERHLGDMSRDYEWGNLPQADRAILEGKGFNESDWSLMRAAKPDAETGLLGMQQIRDVPDDVVRGVISDKIREIEAQAADLKSSPNYDLAIGSRVDRAVFEAKRDTYLKITSMALDEAEMAILQPGLFTQTLFQVKKGELFSELGGALFQFKTFPLAMWNQHMLQRANMFGSKADALKYRFGTLAITSVFAGAGMLMYDLATGKDPRDVTEQPVKFGTQAILKGGALGFFSDLLDVVMDTDNKRSVGEKLTGPFLGVIGKTVDVSHEAIKATQGEDNKVAYRSIQLAREFLPFNNLIWTRAVWNNIFMAELNELVNPGYMGRMQGLAEKNYNQQYYLGMGAEPRMPNISNAWGERQ